MRALAAALAALFLLAVGAQPAAAGEFLTRTAPDGRVYRLYVPTAPQGPAPLVVMLHGCTQDPTGFAAGTRMNEVAEANGFLVAYPQQTQAANSNRCWNWFLPAHQARGRGEPASIAGVVEDVARAHAVDRQRVYVAGLSAGGAQAVIMGVTYPDVFAALSVNAGLEYKAAESLNGAFLAMNFGGPAPDTQGRRAYEAMGTRARPVPTIVFHGTADYTVRPVNGDQVVAQAAQTADLASDGRDDGNYSATPDTTARGQVPGGRAYTVTTYDGLIERWTIQGMAHAWSGGSTAGTYTDPAGPDASTATWRFFTEHPHS